MAKKKEKFNEAVVAITTANAHDFGGNVGDALAELYETMETHDEAMARIYDNKGNPKATAKKKAAPKKKAAAKKEAEKPAAEDQAEADELDPMWKPGDEEKNVEAAAE